MILVSEIGDETFIIAALLAMRNPKYIVFAGAMGALTAMTVISAGLGVIAPLLISRESVKSIATALYIFFGLRLFWIAYYVRRTMLHTICPSAFQNSTAFVFSVHELLFSYALMRT